MSAESPRKEVKTGVLVGGGPPPGYVWNVDILAVAHDEAMGFLDAAQHDHLADQVRELARSPDPTHSQAIDVRPVEDFFEIRDKGGVLRKFNVRVFFCVHKPARKVVVLGVINKQNDGHTPLGDRVRMRNRRRQYLDRYGREGEDNGANSGRKEG